MPETASELDRSVLAMRPFVPAKNFAVSKAFYIDIGMKGRDLGDKLMEMRLGQFSFLLQDYYVAQWADNFMMHLLVSDVELWWKHLSSLDLPGRYSVKPPSAPKLEPWGLKVTYLVDPSGLLWHVAEAKV